ncbi:ornithine cyclodeaminase/alanine dehydrogenase-like protein (mu-crystallin family) [Aequitasia blattaphilus]|uniref:Ornithine cyclodeaminase family protein n=1 Tax=Aequitasia blattaphilus TaxID=2949332 RepID=A0ABT1E637_9FIRM|nr:ornithine cyclodeaminase family protein [Aequitasia blattaphilus]MCP1101279.1 ornithine cyclodeaminase family protein [Aequitasia blattaphilus]MCR8613919.1 ornithine cyclodeaminase family protein [Aequitasia blattaphilus]
MIVLGKEEIKKRINLNEMMDEIEHAYTVFGEGNYFMPPRQSVEDSNKTMMYMPCYTKEVIGTKILSIFPENAKINLPLIDGVVLLNDVETGQPIAVLDGQTITAYRTGAVGGVGIRHFAKKDAKSVGIIGAGTQGYYQALFAACARELERVNLFNRRGKDMEEYKKNLKEEILEKTGREVEICEYKEVEELVKKSDILCTTTTATAPVLPNDAEQLRGKCIISIGSYTPEMREIPDVVCSLVDKVYIELPYAMEETGDLAQPLAEGILKEENVVLMSDYLKGERRAIEKGETTYFKSVGMALFDICVSHKILNTKEN